MRSMVEGADPQANRLWHGPLRRPSAATSPRSGGRIYIANASAIRLRLFSIP